jgi:hypothetical protein
MGLDICCSSNVSLLSYQAAVTILIYRLVATGAVIGTKVAKDPVGFTDDGAKVRTWLVATLTMLTA